MVEAGRSYQIPIEQSAASYFAVMMLALVYQPGTKHALLLPLYFLKQLIRRPNIFLKAFPPALREKRGRTKWYRQWLLDHSQKLANHSELRGNV